MALWATCTFIIQMLNGGSEVMPEAVRPILFAWASALLLTGIFTQIFKKEIEEHCTKTTKIITIMFTAMFSLGMCAYFMLRVMWLFGNTSKRPIAYPVSKAILFVAVIVCIILLCMYIYAKRKSNIKGGYYIDIFTLIVYAIPFVLVYNVMGCIISDYLASYL